MFTFVVGIDANESRALAQAEAIAELPLDVDEVQAVLLHSFEEKTKGSTVEQVKPVRLARNRLEEADIEVEVEGYGGDAARAILNVADEHDADQIVLAGRKRTPTGKALFGSVTQSVILDTDRPVLVCSGSEKE
jgi:nucleotide-binding universal stress UspA family protein